MLTGEQYAAAHLVNRYCLKINLKEKNTYARSS